jgi:hypothetical protein
MTKRSLAAAAFGVLSLLTGRSAVAQTYDLSWWTVDGGGATFSTGGPYSLGATIGQPDASRPLTGGSFSVAGGFWSGGTINQPPVLDPIGNRTVTEGATLTFQINATDPDGNPLTYSASSLPSGASFDPPSRTFTWTPDYTQAGSYPGVHFAVSDGNGGSDFEDITITVTNTNRPPVLAAIGNRSVAEGGTLTFTVSASDPDGDPLTYSASNLPSGATFDTVTRTFTWTPDNTQSGSYPGVTFNVNDGLGGTDSEAITITVFDADERVELSHGSVVSSDLAALPGPVARIRRYGVSQKPYASYEVVTDASSGDIGPTLNLQRIAADGTTAQASTAVGVGYSRSLRWMNAQASPVDTEGVQVSSGQCGTNCGTDDTFRIRMYETTYTIPRFNNSGSQITILILQNPTDYSVSGNIYFWSATGTLLATRPFNLDPKNMLGLNTSTVAGATGVGGTMTVAHDARYGDLAGKTVALEPSTGFSFDSPMVSRPR